MGLFWQEWLDKTYIQKRERVIIHVLFWLMYMSFLSFTAYEHLALGYTIQNIIAWFIWLCPVYLIGVHYFIIYTAYTYFQKQRFVKACIATVIAFILYVHADIAYSYFLISRLKAANVSTKLKDLGDFGSFYLNSINNAFSIMHSLFMFVLYLFIPVSCKFFRDTQRAAKKLRELKERNMQLELNLIKSQMSPHFLLNTLNNIYGITLNGTRQQIGGMILSLSDFLKYTLYDCDNEFVPIKKEIGLIENYIELEAVRSEFIHTVFDIDMDESSCHIPPFLLFPLIENAFKHGTVNLIKPTEIIAKLSVKNNRLYFRVENDLPTGGTTTGGIGLTGLKKKIEYYYPDSATLSSTVESNRYIAELQITDICQK